jgi:hypothetical protein
MILAPTLSLNTPARGYDADATAFAAASGATDVAALSAFVKGVKELGLWSNMVCWPLRSSQNAGTGTTAYSLGGLGTFNGTLTNGPTWGANGLTVSGHNQGVEITVTPTSMPEIALFSVGAVASLADLTHNLALMAWSSFGGTQNGANLRASEFTGDSGFVHQTATPTTAGVFFANSTNFFGYSVSANATDMQVKRFPATQSAATALAGSGDFTNTNPLYIGRRLVSSSGSFGGTVSIATLFTKDIRSNWDQLYNLYRATLCTGLGLP